MNKLQSSSVTREIRNIRKSFVSIARSFERLAPALASTTSAGYGNGRTASGRRRPKLTAADIKVLKLQGQYMGTMRGLSVRNQSKVKTNKEYAAITAEIDGTKAKIDAAETLGLEALEVEENAETEIEETGKANEVLKKELDEERARIEAQIKEKNARLAENQDEREKRIEQLPLEFQDLYQPLNDLHVGSAVVPVTEGSCGGCNVGLTSQRILDARKGDGSARCENCGRILYDDSPAAAATAGDAGS